TGHDFSHQPRVGIRRAVGKHYTIRRIRIWRHDTRDLRVNDPYHTRYRMTKRRHRVPNILGNILVKIAIVESRRLERYMSRYTDVPYRRKVPSGDKELIKPIPQILVCNIHMWRYKAEIRTRRGRNHFHKRI